MKIAIAELVSTSPYSQSRHYADEVAKLAKEQPDAYEKRTWRNRLHVQDNQVFMPGTAFANGLKTSAKRLKLQVPGKGRVEYTKYFEAGVMVPDNLVLPLKPDDVACDKLFVPSDGRRGGGKRVMKYFPRIDKWKGEVTFYIFDDLIVESVFRQVLVAAGVLVGVGRFRPESCGFYGRFDVKSITWKENAEDAFAEAAE